MTLRAMPPKEVLQTIGECELHDSPRIWVWRKLLRHGKLSTSMLEHFWNNDKLCLEKWKSDIVLLREALYSLRDNSIIACTNGLWWLRDPRQFEVE